MTDSPLTWKDSQVAPDLLELGYLTDATVSAERDHGMATFASESGQQRLSEMPAWAGRWDWRGALALSQAWLPGSSVPSGFKLAHLSAQVLTFAWARSATPSEVERSEWPAQRL